MISINQLRMRLCCTKLGNYAQAILEETKENLLRFNLSFSGLAVECSVGTISCGLKPSSKWKGGEQSAYLAFVIFINSLLCAFPW